MPSPTALARAARAKLLIGTPVTASVLGAIEKQMGDTIPPTVKKAIPFVLGGIAIYSKKPAVAMICTILALAMGTPEARDFGRGIVA